KRDYYPVTPSQKRMVILQNFENVGTGYHMPIIFKAEGSLDVEQFRSALQRLVDRHEILRTSFHLINGEVVQKVHEKVTLPFSQSRIPEPEVSTKISEWMQPFQLDRPPLLRAHVF